MNPSDYFNEGSEGYLQTKQAIDMINAGRAAGLQGMDQYEQELKASIAIAKQSGGKNWKGFDANRQAIAGLAPQIQAIGKQKNEFTESAKNINATLRMFAAEGGEISEGRAKAIGNAIQSEDSAALDAWNNLLAEEAKTQAERNRPVTPEDQIKRDLDAQKLAEAKQKAEAEKEELANAKKSAAETLKDKYKAIKSIKSDPNVKSAFGIPISRLIPGTDESSLSAKVDQLSNQEWIDSLIETKAAGATFGALTEKEGAKLASAATLLSNPSALNYETANAELQKMAESVKKLYRQTTGKDLKEEVKAEEKTKEEAAKKAEIDRQNQITFNNLRVTK